ncbi:sulfotransferase [Rhodoferax sp.]|uniref:tetratricopeptide repeat-containing sulfotransferase family protein n=1 Tax=Rhodoferax sp. TaxID=50421 RepID=UPI0026334FA2|nr:sulfotransferase [Rhodoferax sp.]MDD2919183.1 sulfotransferase [Rhodoferax sp.]
MTVNETLQSLSNLASHLLQSGRVPEAIKAYQRLLAMKPDLPDSWYNLGYLQQRMRLFEVALTSYSRALQYGVYCPEEVQLNRAVILAEHLGKTSEALSEIDLALQLNPRYVPALLNLGNIHEQCGERKQALAAYEAVLVIEPANALALSRLPNLKLAIGASDPLIERLERAIANPGITAAERADLGFGLGKALDSAAEYDRAFAAYSAANDASRLSAHPGGARYDALAHERFIDRLVAAFPSHMSYSKQLAGPVQPLFICGMFRSGSTLVEQVLASHAQVTGGGEIDLLPTMAREHLMPLLNESTGAIEPSKLQQLRDIYLSKVAARFPGSKLVTDKRPDNFLNIGLIKLLFPEAKIIHTRRHAIDNCLSIFFLHLSRSMPYALDLLDIAHWYRQYERLMAHWKSVFGDDIHDVDYDGMVTDFEPTIRRLLSHCELPWDATCLAFHKTNTVVMTPSAWQVRQPLYTRSSGRWRHYERHLDALRAAFDRPLSA